MKAIAKARVKKDLTNLSEYGTMSYVRNGNGEKGGNMGGVKRGDVVQFYSDNGGWRTGVYDHTVERGKKFGMMIVNVTVPAYEKKMYVRPENVRELIHGTK